MRRRIGVKRLIMVAPTVAALVLATASVATAGSSHERPFKEISPDTPTTSSTPVPPMTLMADAVWIRTG
jgi:hypothetical protein